MNKTKQVYPWYKDQKIYKTVANWFWEKKDEDEYEDLSNDTLNDLLDESNNSKNIIEQRYVCKKVRYYTKTKFNGYAVCYEITWTRTLNDWILDYENIEKYI